MVADGAEVKPLNVEGAQGGRDGSIGPVRKGTSELGISQKFDLEAVARTDDVAVLSVPRSLRDLDWGLVVNEANGTQTGF